MVHQANSLCLKASNKLYSHLFWRSLSLRQIPQERLFVETDDYDISIDEVYERVAGLLGVEVEDFEAVIEKNFETIFGAK